MQVNVNADVGPYLVPLLVVGLVVLRLIRNKPRKIKPNRLFLTPLFVVLATALTLNQMGLPSPVWLVADVGVAAVGAGVGYVSARHREFTLDPATGEIMSRATPIGTIIFAALFAARFALRLAFPELNGAQAYPIGHGQPAANVIGWTDAGLIFSTVLLVTTATTTWLRTRHLAEARRAQRSAKEDLSSGGSI